MPDISLNSIYEVAAGRVETLNFLHDQSTPISCPAPVHRATRGTRLTSGPVVHATWTRRAAEKASAAGLNMLSALRSQMTLRIPWVDDTAFHGSATNWVTGSSRSILVLLAG